METGISVGSGIAIIFLWWWGLSVSDRDDEENPVGIFFGLLIRVDEICLGLSGKYFCIGCFEIGEID